MHATKELCSVDDGVLNLKKEAGWTSHEVVAKLRQILGKVKVGHGGTLDPMATGVLPVLVGRGTRIAEYLVEWEKEYHAVLRLGEATDTQDATGTVTARRSTKAVTDDAIHQVVSRFHGPVEQLPPMYSAVKVGGVPLYRAARAGKTIPRSTRMVTIHHLDVLDIQGHDVTLRVVCSKGTYVRTLCADIGEALGVGGHLAALVRTRVGPLSIDQALTIEEITRHHASGRLGQDLYTMKFVLERFPCVEVDDPTAGRVKHGVPVSAERLAHAEGATSTGVKRGTPIRIQDCRGQLLAIGSYSDRHPDTLRIDKVLAAQDA
ncbi:MAG TPA: tRNA pseudouridine(55) synthase TruB [Nitrospiraceae bacterium]|jgi:tRNA pseudouridine55 synthase